MREKICILDHILPLRVNARRNRTLKRAFKIEESEIMRFSEMPQNPENPPIPDSQKNWILQATYHLATISYVSILLEN
jgi:hypothetical protein